jgi:Tfp pilus assembly protein PilO
MMKTRSSMGLRKQQLWVLGIGLVFAADFALCGYLPSRSRLAVLQGKKTSYEQTIQAGRAKGAQLQACRKRLSDTDEIVRHYDAYVPTDGALGTFLRQASELMTKHQLADQVVVAGKEIPAGDLTCIPVHVTGSGGLNEIFSFFQDMKSMDRLVRIDRTTMKNDAAFSGRIAMEAEVFIYYRSGKTAGGKTAGGASHGV